MGAPQAAGPTFIDPTANTAYFSGTNAQHWFIKALNGALYLYQYRVGTGGGNIEGSGIFKSTDGGTTWNQMDVANSPVNATGSIFYDVANERLIVGLVQDTFPQTVQPVYLKNFDLTTDLWGADYAPAGPNALTRVQHVFKRIDGTILLVYDFGPTNPGGTSRLRGSIWSGAAWSASIDLGAALLPFQANGNILVSATCADMDPATGDVHLAFFGNAGNLIYQNFKADDTLGQSDQWTTAGLSFSGNHFGSLAIFNGVIYLPYCSNGLVNNAVLIGTPLAAPIWSVVTPANMAFPGGLIHNSGFISADTTQLYWEINFVDAGFTLLSVQLFTSTDGGLTWTVVPDNATPSYLYDFGTSPLAPDTDTAFFSASAEALYLVVSGLTTTAYAFALSRNTVIGGTLGYFMNSEAFVLGPPLAIADSPPAGFIAVPYSHCFAASGGTPPYSFMVSAGSLPPGLVLDPLTGCVSGLPGASGTWNFTISVTDSAAGTASVAASITISGVGGYSGGLGGKSGVNIIIRCCNPLILVAERLRTLLKQRNLWPYTDLFPPKVCTPLNQIGVIDAPLNNVATVVLAYQVPSGMRLILHAILQAKSPLPIAVGDASWTLDVDAPVGIPNVQAMGIQGLTALQGPLGSIQTGERWLLPRPYTFEPLTVLRSKVTTTAAIPPGPGNRFTSGFFGYLIPVSKGK